MYANPVHGLTIFVADGCTPTDGVNCIDISLLLRGLISYSSGEDMFHGEVMIKDWEQYRRYPPRHNVLIIHFPLFCFSYRLYYKTAILKNIVESSYYYIIRLEVNCTEEMDFCRPFWCLNILYLARQGPAVLSVTRGDESYGFW